MKTTPVLAGLLGVLGIVNQVVGGVKDRGWSRVPGRLKLLAVPGPNKAVEDVMSL